MIDEKKERELYDAYIDDAGLFIDVGAAWEVWLAAKRHADEDAEKWLPIESAPKDGTRVLVYYKNASGKGRIAHAQYIPRFTEESNEDFAEYCEERDEYYTPEGWYEICESYGDYTSMHMPDEPISWCPLPAPPAATVLKDLWDYLKTDADLRKAEHDAR